MALILAATPICLGVAPFQDEVDWSNVNFEVLALMTKRRSAAASESYARIHKTKYTGRSLF